MQLEVYVCLFVGHLIEGAGQMCVYLFVGLLLEGEGLICKCLPLIHLSEGVGQMQLEVYVCLSEGHLVEGAW